MKRFAITPGLASAWAARPVRIRSQPVHTPFIRAGLPRHDRGYDIGGLLSSHFGALGGILIPLLLHRFGIDPAVSSSAFVTTVTDVVRYSSFLGIAALWFGLG